MCIHDSPSLPLRPCTAASHWASLSLRVILWMPLPMLPYPPGHAAARASAFVSVALSSRAITRSSSSVFVQLISSSFIGSPPSGARSASSPHPCDRVRSRRSSGPSPWLARRVPQRRLHEPREVAAAAGRELRVGAERLPTLGADLLGPDALHRDRASFLAIAFANSASENR